MNFYCKHMYTFAKSSRLLMPLVKKNSLGDCFIATIINNILKFRTFKGLHYTNNVNLHCRRT